MAITTKQSASGYLLLQDGKVVGRAWKNGQRNVAGRSWSYRLTGQQERRANSLRACREAAERELKTKCTQCLHDEMAHGYRPTQGTYWCVDCSNWCDLVLPGEEDEQ